MKWIGFFEMGPLHQIFTEIYLHQSIILSSLE